MAFLPAMPHDATEEVRQALLDARYRGGDQNPVLWSKLLLLLVVLACACNIQYLRFSRKLC